MDTGFQLTNRKRLSDRSIHSAPLADITHQKTHERPEKENPKAASTPDKTDFSGSTCPAVSLLNMSVLFTVVRAVPLASLSPIQRVNRHCHDIGSTALHSLQYSGIKQTRQITLGFPPNLSIYEPAI